MLNAPVYLAAYEAGLLYLAALLCLCALGEENALVLEYIIPYRGKICIEHKSQRKAVVLLQQGIEMRMAEAQTICLDTHIRLHHGSAHNVFRDVLLHGVSHGADRAALARLEHFIYRDSEYTFSHGF